MFLRGVSNELPGGFNNATQSGDYPVSEMTYMIFQCMFAAITPALAIGSAAERGRVLPGIIFIFIWSTLVYDPIAHWNWAPNGWAFPNGLDFAGGTPVHISSGFAALAYCFLLKERHDLDNEEIKAHNISNVVLGTVFLWFGWFGFNGGSALGATPRATNAFVITNLAASVAGITWMALDYRVQQKLSAVAFCSGAIAGLVAITPASGFVSPPSSVAFGICAGVFCNLASKLKEIFSFDDACDVFAVHGIGGIVGNILTGIFAQKYIAHLDGTTNINGGWLDSNWVQLGYQIADSVSGAGYSFVVSWIILWLMDKIPFLTIRAHIDAERHGLDKAEIGESAYQYVDELVVSNARHHIDPRPIEEMIRPVERG